MQFLPDHVYCFLPSLYADQGSVRVYDHMPKVVKEFLYCMEIKNVEIVNNCSGPHQERSKMKPLEGEENLSIPEDGQFQRMKRQNKRVKRGSGHFNPFHMTII